MSKIKLSATSCQVIDRSCSVVIEAWTVLVSGRCTCQHVISVYIVHYRRIFFLVLSGGSTSQHNGRNERELWRVCALPPCLCTHAAPNRCTRCQYLPSYNGSNISPCHYLCCYQFSFTNTFITFPHFLLYLEYLFFNFDDNYSKHCEPITMW